MANTKAIARALRSMTNVGMTALEEIAYSLSIIDVLSLIESPHLSTFL